MALRALITELAHALFKRDVDALLAKALRLNEQKKLSNKDWEAFGDIALRYRSFLLD